MTAAQQMVETVHAYVEAFDRGDAAAVAALFARDARLEDPVGSPPRIGRDDIHEFYASAMQTGAKLTLDSPVRAGASTAAFAFHVALDHQGAPMRIDVIDLFRFNDAGQIESMTAIWGDGNVSVGQPE